VHVNAAIGFARDGAADDVDDGQRAMAAALGLFSFSGLSLIP